MKTSFTFPEKTFIAPCINIKTYRHSKLINQSGTGNGTNKVKAVSEKAVVINMPENTAENKISGIELTHTIQPGDNKRLNRDGVLRVYDLSKPVDIPVIRLLGKWNKAHVGVTLAVIDKKWRVKQ